MNKYMISVVLKLYLQPEHCDKTISWSTELTGLKRGRIMNGKGMRLLAQSVCKRDSKASQSQAGVGCVQKPRGAAS